MDGVNLRCTIREPVLNERTSAALGHTSSASSAEAVSPRPDHILTCARLIICFIGIIYAIQIA